MVNEHSCPDIDIVGPTIPAERPPEPVYPKGLLGIVFRRVGMERVILFVRAPLSIQVAKTAAGTQNEGPLAICIDDILRNDGLVSKPDSSMSDDLDNIAELIPFVHRDGIYPDGTCVL